MSNTQEVFPQNQNIALEQSQNTRFSTIKQQLAVAGAVAGFAFAGANTSNEAQAQSSATPEACAGQALQAPTAIKGNYHTYKPFKYQYTLSYTLPGMSEACQKMGSRVVTAYQARAYDVQKPYIWDRASKPFKETSESAKRVSKTLVVGRSCWKDNITGPSDKKVKAVERPTVVVKWTPNSGSSSTATFAGSKKRVCK